LHFAQRKDDLANGAWTNFTNNILGDVTNVTITDPGPVAQLKRFNRIGLSI